MDLRLSNIRLRDFEAAISKHPQITLDSVDLERGFVVGANGTIKRKASKFPEKVTWLSNGQCFLDSTKAILPVFHLSILLKK